jgi:hypothetical protein
MIKGSPSKEFYENYSHNEFQKLNITPFWLENVTRKPKSSNRIWDLRGLRLFLWE